jgi:hypothetical protein
MERLGGRRIPDQFAILKKELHLSTIQRVLLWLPVSTDERQSSHFELNWASTSGLAAPAVFAAV